MIHYKASDGFEHWKKYNDDGGYIIHYVIATGVEKWSEYDKNNNLIHEKHSDGREYWYDENSNLIHEKTSNGEDAYYKYDKHGKCNY